MEWIRTIFPKPFQCILNRENIKNLAYKSLNKLRILFLFLKEFGIKTDSNAVRDWFKQADFNDDGFVDFFDWGRLLDVEAGKLQKVFQVQKNWAKVQDFFFSICRVEFKNLQFYLLEACR